MKEVAVQLSEEGARQLGTGELDSSIKQVQAMSAARVENFYIRFHTLHDNKDAGDVVSAAIHRADNGGIVAYQAVLGDPGHDWVSGSDQPNAGDASWGGQPSWFVIARKEVEAYQGEALYWIVSKTGDRNWWVRVEIGCKYQGIAGIYTRYYSGNSRIPTETGQRFINDNFVP